jgi:hypothetical protein
MMPLAELDVAEPTLQDCDRLHALLGTAGLRRCDELEAYRSARLRADIGLSSLEVILLLVCHMERSGLDTGTFSPDWIGFLDTVPGIIHVMTLIDDAAAHG